MVFEQKAKGAMTWGYDVLTEGGQFMHIPAMALEDREVAVETSQGRLVLPLNFCAAGVDIAHLKQIKRADTLRETHAKRRTSELMQAWSDLARG